MVSEGKLGANSLQNFGWVSYSDFCSISYGTLNNLGYQNVVYGYHNIGRQYTNFPGKGYQTHDFS